MTAYALSGHFGLSGADRGFVLHRKPSVPIKGCVLLVPPFAEEANKCRRMMAQVADGLARSGIASLALDFSGTGDSMGDFAEASLTAWMADVESAASLGSRLGTPVTSILAVRFGCALALDALATRTLTPLAATVFWQPVLDGKKHMTQFLRLRVAASMTSDARESVSQLKGVLARDGILEVAGYALPRQLAEEMEALAVPQALPDACGAVSWFEVGRDPMEPLSDEAQRMAATRSSSGRPFEGRNFPGEPFWAATEIVENTAVVDATVEAILRAHALPPEGSIA